MPTEVIDGALMTVRTARTRHWCGHGRHWIEPGERYEHWRVPPCAVTAETRRRTGGRATVTPTRSPRTSATSWTPTGRKPTGRRWSMPDTDECDRCDRPVTRDAAGRWHTPTSPTRSTAALSWVR